MKYRTKFNSIGYNKFGGSSLSVNHSDDHHTIKSGIVTQSFNKQREDSELSFSFFDNELIHTDIKLDKREYFFHDSRTINFLEKNIIPTAGIESKYISNNILTEIGFYNKSKIVNTPNTYPFYEIINSNNSQVGVSGFEQQTFTQNPHVYDRMLKENYLEDMSCIFKEDNDVLEKTEINNIITIDYDLKKSNNSDIYLSFSKKGNTREVTFPDGTSYHTFNGNTVYLYNPEYIKNNFGPYDYLGNISSDYKHDVGSFVANSPICFSSASTGKIREDITSNPALSDSIIKSSYGSIPISNFGFPFDSKYAAKDRHIIKASDYISKPFVIEKVCLEFTMSNWSVSLNDQQGEDPCLNFVNLFLINQRGILNTSNLDNSLKTYYGGNSMFINIDPINYEGDTVFTSNNKDQNSNFTQSQIDDMELHGTVLGDSVYNSDFIQTNNIQNIDKKYYGTQQRDIITSVSIANYASGKSNPDNHMINLEKIENSVDLLINKSQSPLLDSSNDSECIYTNESIKIVAPVKHFYENKNLPKFTSFDLYPGKPSSDRTNLSSKSGRSIIAENLNNTSNKEIILDVNNKNVILNEKMYEESSYILLPSDNLVLGISLSNSFECQEDYPENNNIRIGEDLVKISSSNDYPFKIHLIGHYQEDKNKKIILNKESKQYKNTKKIGYFQKELVDQVGSNLGYLDNNFYDREIIGRSGFLINKNKYSSQNKIKLGNFFELPSFGKPDIDDFVAGVNYPHSEYTSSLPTNDYFTQNDEKYSIKHYFNKYHFGMPIDKLYYSLIHQFDNSKYFNINKRFMSGYFKQKKPAKISGKLIFNFNKINEFKGTNYLKEKIMSSTTGKTAGKSSLSFKITDNDQNSVSVYLLTDSTLGIANGANQLNPPRYSVSDLFSVIENNKVILTEVDPVIYNAFIKSNETYPLDLEIQKRAFVDLVASSINEINNKSQQEIDDSNNVIDFKLNVTAEVVEESLHTNLVEIKITLDKLGTFGNPTAKIEGDEFNSCVSFEDFSIEEGELIKSYNTNKNAYYNSSEIIFSDT
jgi:hypothetical protein